MVNLTRISQHTGFSKSHLSRVFKYETRPSVECLVLISEALDLAMDETLKRLKTGGFSVKRGV